MSKMRPSRSRLRASPQARAKIGKSERTRAAILNAAFDFLWSHPFRDMTVAAVMDGAGASRSAFYQYFDGRHHLMETLLGMLEAEILSGASPWITDTGDPVALLREALAELVRVCYRQGPFLRAVTDAAPTDERLEDAWNQFLGRFDDAGCGRIEADQEQGLIAPFEARPVAVALNRLNAHALIEAFGRLPRSRPRPVQDALTRIWVATLYGEQWLARESSTLVRT